MNWHIRMAFLMVHKNASHVLPWISHSIRQTTICQMANDYFIALAGNIGTGKSQLSIELAPYLQARPEIEDISQNMFFEKFGANPLRWAFPSQLAFAAEAAARHIRVQDGAAVVMDRTLYEGVAVFAKLFASRNQLRKDQLELLIDLSEMIMTLPRQPQLLVYLTAGPAVLLERIEARARPGEEKIDLSYLANLDLLYRDFIDTWDRCPVIVVNSETRDMRTPRELKSLTREINSYLA
jgi:deoxyadenosine/deoxycytidine kinase